MLLREFLMRAKTIKDTDRIGNFYLSEKLDGTRCFWDGGVSRNIPIKEVPWANIHDPKNPRQLKKKLKPLATGLWSGYGNPIIAPDWFLNTLPCCPLDGELWAGRGKFQRCRSICAGDSPGDGWEEIKYMVYGSPPLQAVFGDGEIRDPNFRSVINYRDCMRFITDHASEDFTYLKKFSTFDQEIRFLQYATSVGEGPQMVNQMLLPKDEEEARRSMSLKLKRILSEGGEGVVLRDAGTMWKPKRVSSLLKVKPSFDDCGTLVGFTSGRKTNRGSKLLGKIGALILDYKGLRLELAGLKAKVSRFCEPWDAMARRYPGKDMPEYTTAECFTRGQLIEFKYRELSDRNIPKDARFLRVRESVDD